MEGILPVIIIAYTAWAIYSGFKIVSGRSEWLDRKQPLNIIVKIIVCIVVGYFVGFFYLLYLLLKMMGLFR